MNERIRQIRKELGLTQQEMADGLGVKRNTVGAYEVGYINPSERTISDICRVYDVNEIWLRTGEGEMFKPRTREMEIASYLGDLLGGGRSDFQRRFISVLAKLTPEEWDFIEKKVHELTEN